MTQLDSEFVRSQFPAFSEPSLDGWGFFENAGGSYTCRQVIAQLNAFREDYGSREDFEIHALDSKLRSIDDCRRLAELGVTDICVTPWNPYDPSLSLGDKLRGIEQFAERVIAKM